MIQPWNSTAAQINLWETISLTEHRQGGQMESRGMVDKALSSGDLLCNIAIVADNHAPY